MKSATMAVHGLVLNCLLATCMVAQNLPNIIPPAPSATQIQRYGDYPVSHFTGVPQISIPLYTIQNGDITLPVTLDYHASGIKVADANGLYGSGWTLKAGGLISLSVVGASDTEMPIISPFKKADEIQPTTNEGLSYLRQIEANRSTEHDIYSYTFGYQNGKFALKDDADHTPILFPYKPFKINKEKDSRIIGNQSFFSYTRFEIIDDKGFTYKFGESEDGSLGGSFLTDVGESGGWEMSEMISPTNHKVTFAYTSGDQALKEELVLRNEYLEVDDYASTAFVGDCSTGEDLYSFYAINRNPIPVDDGASIRLKTFGIRGMSEINFQQGRLKFTYAADTKMLSKLEVLDNNNHVVKSMIFTIAPFPIQTYRYRLESIKFYDAAGKYINQYSFEYHDGAIPSYLNTNAIDFWGYANGKTGNINLIPRWDNFIVQPEKPGYYAPRTYGYADRSADESYMMQHTIKSIHYPTGGSTTFDFESNKYRRYNQSGGPLIEAGGLRVKQITNYDHDDHISGIKVYKYGSDESGAGFIEFEPDMEYFYTTQRVAYLYNNCLGNVFDYRRTTFYSTPLIDLAPHGSPVVYPYVTEYLSDGQNILGKTVYNYDLGTIAYRVAPNTVDVAGRESFPVNNLKYQEEIKYWNLGGELSSQTTYKQLGNNQYSLVTSQSYDYEEHVRDNLRDFKLFRFSIPQLPCTQTVPCTSENAMEIEGDPGSPFKFGDSYIISGEKRLIKTTIRSYDNSGNNSLTITTEYTSYNNFNTQPTQTVTYNSKGEAVTTQLKYVTDFSSSATPNVYNTMIDRNILTPVIEQSTSKNSMNISSVKTNYLNWPGSIIAPLSVETSIGQNPYKAKILFLSYDNLGNILGVAKKDDRPKAYIWGYNQAVPIAEVDNGSPENIAYTSFESPQDMGNWSYPNTGISSFTWKTGKYSYALSASTMITKSLAPGKYRLEYCSTAPITILGGTVADISTSSADPIGWILYKKEITISQTTTLTLSTSEGSIFIDELRLYPSTAQMSSYTYDILVGQTSVCDKNAQITHFKYDDYGRLQLVKDDQGNIIRTYSYSFKN